MVHVIVIDETGEITGTAGTVLEKFVDYQAPDAKDDLNQSNYYKNVINDRSEWIWWSDHPTAWTKLELRPGHLLVELEYGVMVPQMVTTDSSLGSGVDGSPAASDVQQEDIYCLLMTNW